MIQDIRKADQAQLDALRDPQVLEVVTDLSGWDGYRVVDTARLGPDLGFDSLDLCNLTLVLETEFMAGLPKAEIQSDTTVAQVLDIVCERGGQPRELVAALAEDIGTPSKEIAVNNA